MTVAMFEDGKFHREASCQGCAHQISQFSCYAFPNGIPGDILWGKHAHTEPYPGDHGLQFDGVGDPSHGLPNTVSTEPINFFGDPQDPKLDYWGQPRKKNCNVYGATLLYKEEIASMVAEYKKKK